MNTQSAGSVPQPIVERDRQSIVSVFKDNEKLLKSLRALFLNLGLTPEEKASVRSLSSEIKRIIRDRFYPVMDKDTPIGLSKDVWLGAETMVFGHSKDSIKQAIEYKDKALKMTQAALELLDEDGTVIDLRFDARKSDDLGVNLLARNQYIRHVESQLYSLWIIANQKEETPNQAKKRAQLDSSK